MYTKLMFLDYNDNVFIDHTTSDIETVQRESVDVWDFASWMGNFTSTCPRPLDGITTLAWSHCDEYFAIDSIFKVVILHMEYH